MPWRRCNSRGWQENNRFRLAMLVFDPITLRDQKTTHICCCFLPIPKSKYISCCQNLFQFSNRFFISVLFSLIVILKTWLQNSLFFVAFLCSLLRKSMLEYLTKKRSQLQNPLVGMLPLRNPDPPRNPRRNPF